MWRLWLTKYHPKSNIKFTVKYDTHDIKFVYTKIRKIKKYKYKYIYLSTRQHLHIVVMAFLYEQLDVFQTSSLLFSFLILLTFLAVVSNGYVIITIIVNKKFHSPNHVLESGFAMANLLLALFICLLQTLPVNWMAIHLGKKLEGSHVGDCYSNETLSLIHI